MTRRGVIAEDHFADLVLFDPETVLDLASYDEPKLEPQGIDTVIVNGAVAYEKGEHRYANTGKMLRFRRSAYGED